MSKIGLILLAHGSRDSGWTRSFDRLVHDLTNEAGESRVCLAFMELASPSLKEAVGTYAKSGITHIRVLPLFMAMGKHLERDIPKQIEDLAAQFTTIQFKLLPSILDFPSVYAAIKTAAQGALEN